MKLSTLKMSSADLKTIILIIGPTCVGKTEISISLAQKFNGEILSADSRTFYKGMDIGTAKPSKEDQERVRHYMVDIAEPGETISLSIFQKKSKELINDILIRGKIPFIVGGTGQYIRAITQQWESPAVEPQLELRKILEEIAEIKGNLYLHGGLRTLDPYAADNIDPRNVRRTIRALEVIFTTGIPFSTQRKKGKPDYAPLTIGLTRPREELYERIDRRIDSMFESGLVSEVEKLVKAGFSETTSSMSAIGYKECIQIIKGDLTEYEAKTEIKRKTRVFVRRQANWFKPTDKNIRWFDLTSISIIDIENIIKEKMEMLNT